jgi:hypothetical protein
VRLLLRRRLRSERFWMMRHAQRALMHGEALEALLPDETTSGVGWPD